MLEKLTLAILLGIQCTSSIAQDNKIKGENPWIYIQSETNPWAYEKKGQNPWINEASDKNPWVQYTKTETQSQSGETIEAITDNSSDTDTLNEITSSEIIPAAEQIIYTYNQALKLGKTEYNASGAAVNSFLFCGLLNVFGLPFAITPTFIKTDRQYKMTQAFKEANTNVPNDVVDGYKKGTQQKRWNSTIWGSFAGIAFNSILIILLISF